MFRFKTFCETAIKHFNIFKLNAFFMSVKHNWRDQTGEAIENLLTYIYIDVYVRDPGVLVSGEEVSKKSIQEILGYAETEARDWDDWHSGMRKFEGDDRARGKRTGKRIARIGIDCLRYKQYVNVRTFAIARYRSGRRSPRRFVWHCRARGRRASLPPR